MKRKLFTKAACVALSAVFMLNVSIQGSFAYIVTKSLPAENMFLPVDAAEGDVVISKVIKHPFGENYVIPENLEFDFEVNLGKYYSGSTILTTQGEMIADENGIISVCVTPQTPVVIHGLDEGSIITVTEKDVDNDGFEVADGVYTKTASVSSFRPEKISFTNIYTPDSVIGDGLTVDGQLTIDGRPWQEGDSFAFDFEYLNELGEWVLLDTETLSGGSDGKFSFTDIISAMEFDALGVHSFCVSQKDTGASDLLYDTSRNYFYVIVTDKDMDGKLEISNVTGFGNVNVTDNAEDNSFDVDITFTNEYLQGESAVFYSESTDAYLGYDNRFKDEIEVPVYIKNNPGFNTLDFDLYVHEDCVDYLDFEYGDLVADISIDPAVSASAYDRDGNDIDIYRVSFSVKSEEIITGDGLLLNVKYEVVDGITDYETWSAINSTPIEIVVNSFGVDEFAYDYTVDNSSEVRVAFDVMLGDVSLDMVIDSFDALMLRQYLAMNIDTLFIQQWAGQVTGHYLGAGEAALNGYDAIHILEYIVFQAEYWDKLITPAQ